MEQAAADTTKRLAELREVAKLPGLGFEQAVEGDLRLRNAGLGAERSAESLRQFGNALASAGKGAPELDRVTLALGQIATKGKISQEEINQLIEAGVNLAPILKQAFGTADTEQLQKAGITANQFFDAVNKGLAGLPRVSGGIGTAFENAADGIQRAAATVGLSFDKAFDIQGNLNAFGDFVGGLADRFAALDPSTQKLIFGLAGAAAAAGPLLVVIGGIGAALPAVTAGFGLLGVTSIAALGPILPIAAGVALAGYTIYQNWDTIAPAMARVGASFAGVASAYNDLMAAMDTGSMGDLISQSNILDMVVADLSNGITALADTVSALGNTFSAVLRGDIDATLKEAGNYFEAFTRQFRNLLFTMDEAPKGDGLNQYFASMTLNAFAAAGAITAVTAAAEAQVRTVGLLAALEEKLKAARSQQVNAATEKDITAANKLIKSLEDQIKRLKELGVGSDEAAKALAKLREALASIDRQVAAGVNFDPIGDKIKVLESGITGLLDAKVPPNSPLVQSFVAQLGQLEAQYDKLKARIASRQGADALMGDPITPQGPAGLPEVLVMPAFDNSQAQSAAEQLANIYRSLTDAQKETLARTAEFNTNIEALFADAGSYASSALTGIGSAIGEALGAIVTNGATATDALGIMLGGALQALAQVMGQFGAQLVSIGIGKLALDNLFAAGPAGGPAAIAAGLGLIALSGIAAAVGKKTSSSLGSVSGMSATSTRPSSGSFQAGTAVQPQKMELTLKFEPVDLRADGPSLRGALALDSYRLGRTA